MNTGRMGKLFEAILSRLRSDAAGGVGFFLDGTYSGFSCILHPNISIFFTGRDGWEAIAFKTIHRNVRQSTKQRKCLCSFSVHKKRRMKS